MKNSPTSTEGNPQREIPGDLRFLHCIILKGGPGGGGRNMNLYKKKEYKTLKFCLYFLMDYVGTFRQVRICGLQCRRPDNLATTCIAHAGVDCAANLQRARFWH